MIHVVPVMGTDATSYIEPGEVTIWGLEKSL